MMIKKLYRLFIIYREFGFLSGCWTVLRVVILPFDRIDRLIPKKASVVDIGCGNGGLANYLALSSERRVVMGIDINKKRINRAIETSGALKNTEFIYGDVTRHKFVRADCYLICDVLHHIDYDRQIELLGLLVGKMSKKSTLIVKEVDKSNYLPYLFGHFWEKVLYPSEAINVRSKSQWVEVFHDLKLSVKIDKGSWYFPDSTLIFSCRIK